jgi:beta-glucosidase
MNELKALDFGQNFHWGVSTAAYQIEGAPKEDGKGQSIWDHFTHRKGKIYRDQNGDRACEFYYRYASDLQLLYHLGIRNFRFSLSWPRILPQGVTQTNSAGIDFYNRVIDTCLKLGIEPWVTLYHWDLPQALQARGGWTNRDILNWFEEYLMICIRNFGDRVRYWMVLNEPMVYTGAGHFLGVHAPGLQGLKNFLPAIHHATLCQGIGGQMIRSELSSAIIGSTFSCSYLQPASTKERDVQATLRLDALLNRLFLEPALGLGYPVADLAVLKRLESYMLQSDEQKMVFDFDFIGIQNYTREIVKHSFWVPFIKADLMKAADRNVPVSAMGWEIYPESIYHMLKKYHRYNIKSLIITENGLALSDEPSAGTVNDQIRIEYIGQILRQVLRAQQEGVPVHGYFYWTFIDNFEWAEGYYPRFGLVYNHRLKQERMVKQSGHWWQKFLQAQ